MIEAEKTTTRKHLASIAKAMAQISFHGFVDGEGSNLELIIQPFPKWTLEEADRLWCAAFVYYCCVKAGFEIPIRPDECKTCHLAGCLHRNPYLFGVGTDSSTQHVKADRLAETLAHIGF